MFVIINNTQCILSQNILRPNDLTYFNISTSINYKNNVANNYIYFNDVYVEPF